MRPFQPPVYGPFRVWTRAPRTPYTSLFSHLGLPLDSQLDSVLFMCIKEIHSKRLLVCGSVSVLFHSPEIWSRCLFNTSIEIQDPDRGPSPPQAHGVSGWGGAGWHHERQGQLLADAGGVSGKGCARSGEARRHRQINTDALLGKNIPRPRLIFYITRLFCSACSASESCHQVWIYGFGLWRVLVVFYCVVFGPLSLHWHMWPWSTKPVMSSTGIFVVTSQNTLYGSKWSIFLLSQKSLGY